MLDKLQNAITPSHVSSLAKSFSRLGWAGFGLQVIFGALPVLMMVYYFIFSRSTGDSRRGFPFIEYLTAANLLLLLFTTCWSYHYTRLGKRLLDPQRRPAKASVIRAVWTGLIAGAVGMLFSMLLLFLEAAKLLFYFLKAPQAGMPVIQTSGTEAVHWVSAGDMASLVALVITLFAELIVLVFSLWLLFRTTLGSPEFPEAPSKA
jgi:hypothetical protein